MLRDRQSGANSRQPLLQCSQTREREREERDGKMRVWGVRRKAETASLFIEAGQERER